MSDQSGATPATASSTTTTAPASAASVDVSLPKVSWIWRRWFCWILGAALVGALFVAIAKGQPAFAWPIAALLGLDMMFYVGGATTTEIVQLVQSSGIIRAAQATSSAVQAAADAASAIAGRVGGAPPAATPAPTPGLSEE